MKYKIGLVVIALVVVLTSTAFSLNHSYKYGDCLWVDLEDNQPALFGVTEVKSDIVSGVLYKRDDLVYKENLVPISPEGITLQVLSVQTGPCRMIYNKENILPKLDQVGDEWKWQYIGGDDTYVNLLLYNVTINRSTVWFNNIRGNWYILIQKEAK